MKFYTKQEPEEIAMPNIPSSASSVLRNGKKRKLIEGVEKSESENKENQEDTSDDTEYEMEEILGFRSIYTDEGWVFFDF